MENNLKKVRKIETNILNCFTKIEDNYAEIRTLNNCKANKCEFDELLNSVK